VIFAGAAFVEKAMTPGATPEHFEKTFNTNARGTYFTVQKALPHLNDGASIILVASAGKNKGMPGRSTYSASKAAIRSFARTWTNELKDRKIRTNVISPGAVDWNTRSRSAHFTRLHRATKPLIGPHSESPGVAGG
jgi:NAD(P)-dependent dehydrogenase (short-subunit alcohol dehydrogenase family)